MRTDSERAGNDGMIVARNDEEIDTMTVVQLKDELRRRKLKTTGNETMLIERLCAAIILDGQKDDETEDDDEEDNVAASGKSEDDNRLRQQESARSNKACILTFKDVEDSIDTFSGDDGRNIKQWIQDFDETASLCQWNEMQKTIYAKNLLRGSARLFIKYETRSKTWKDIKLALEKEFSLRIDSYDVHKQLMTRRKRNDETYYEYCYRMLEISSQANVETSAVIQYIIDGIVDDEVNKVILYGAKNISELKHKLDIYEIMKTKSRQNNKDDSLYAEIDKLDSKKCFNCDGKNHISATCLAKEKSTKCFKCGHIAANAMGTSTKVVDVNKIDIVDDVNKVDLTYVCNQTCRDELKELKEIIANYQLSEVTREKEELHLKLERMAWEDNARKGLELIEKWEKLNLEKESFAQERHGWYKQISTLLQKSSDEIPEMRKTEEAACQESAQTAIVAVLEKEVENSKVLVADYKNQMEEMNMKIQSMEAELQEKTRQLIKHEASSVNLESFGRQLKDTIAEEYKFKYDDMQVQMRALKEDKASIEEAFRTLDNKNKELLEVIKEKDAATAILQERFQDTIESLETRLQNKVENLTMKERKIVDLEAVIDNKDHELHTKHAQLQNDIITIDSLRDELNDCTMKLKKSEEVASLVSLKRTLGLNDLIKKREKEIKILKDTIEMNRWNLFRSSGLNVRVYEEFTKEREQAEIKYNELQNEYKGVLTANDDLLLQIEGISRYNEDLKNELMKKEQKIVDLFATQENIVTQIEEITNPKIEDEYRYEELEIGFEYTDGWIWDPAGGKEISMKDKITELEQKLWESETKLKAQSKTVKMIVATFSKKKVAC